MARRLFKPLPPCDTPYLMKVPWPKRCNKSTKCRQCARVPLLSVSYCKLFVKPVGLIRLKCVTMTTVNKCKCKINVWNVSVVVKLTNCCCLDSNHQVAYQKMSSKNLQSQNPGFPPPPGTCPEPFAVRTVHSPHPCQKSEQSHCDICRWHSFGEINFPQRWVQRGSGGTGGLVLSKPSLHRQLQEEQL